ncbi:kelch repeat-containing protein [Archangium violaceum]|uniref:Kelch repeat-containing protein n=1 Tax=Archangium violaceum TaxID=83451 RepID=UPI002B318DC4|nr:kelch repeat-containing protein [Archangium gephyra]
MSLIDGPGRAGRSHAPRWVALLMVFGLVACKTQPPEEHTPSGPSLYLELAALNGGAVSKARVRLPSGEERQVTEQGTVLLDQLPVGRQALQVQAEGFSSTVLAFDMGQNVRAGARLQLLPLGEPKRFDASEDKTLPVGDMLLTVPAGALRDAQGNPIQGEVEVYLSALNLDSDELLAAPGLLEGIPVPGAEPVGLESLGMVSLVFQQKGRVIPFARGTQIGGNVPHGRPGSAGTPDGRPGIWRSALSSARTYPSVPIWRLDAESGRWVPTSDKALVTESSTEPGSYRWEATLNDSPSLFNVALPFWWRSPEAFPDNPLRPPTPWWVGTACLEVKVEDDKGQPVAGRMVVAQGVGYTGLSRAMTDADGRVRLEVMKGQLVDVDAGEQARTVNTGSIAGTCSDPGASTVFVALTVTAPTCAPGTTRDCEYSGPTQGICRAAQRTCDALGSAWSACEGEVDPQRERCDNAQDDNCDGTINEWCEHLCRVGETAPCYEGPEGTEDVGLCRAGTRTCVAGGTAWSACEGQVLPSTEDYTRPGDEDCDGVAGMCSPGATRRCAYTGPAGTEDVGVCRASTQTCNGTGTDWSACTGEVTPQTESCTNALDEDCNGQRNEGPCGWVTTTSMSTARSRHSAVVLSNGRVLVMGGANPGGEPLDTAQEYDPASLTWTSVGNMKSKRIHMGAVLLNDGRVLAVGGWDSSSQSKAAEVYDPSTRTWKLVREMNSERDFPTATRLTNGKVLVTGGIGTSSHLDTAEFYDPVANTWTPTRTPMASTRVLHTATLLNDGRVLVTGGHQSDLTRLALTQVYDPVADTWTTVGSMNEARTGHKATLLSTGHVLVTGGSGTSGHVLASEVYNPATDTWTPTVGPLSTARDEHGTVLLSNGRVLVTGGDTGGNANKTAELYDPVSKTWTAAASMNAERTAHAMVLLNTGEVLVIGGSSTEHDSGALTSVEVYNPLNR